MNTKQKGNMMEEGYVFTLNRKEVEILKELREFHNKGNKSTANNLIPTLWAMKGEEQRTTIARLENFGLLDSPKSLRYAITQLGLVKLHSIENPPKKDYIDEAIKWYRSKWWAILISVLAVVPAFFLGWWEIICVVFGIKSDK